MPPRVLSDDQVTALYARYTTSRLTLAQLAAEVGVSLGTLQGEFMRRGLPRKRNTGYLSRSFRRRNR